MLCDHGEQHLPGALRGFPANARSGLPRRRAGWSGRREKIPGDRVPLTAAIARRRLPFRYPVVIPDVTGDHRLLMMADRRAGFADGVVPR